MNLFTIFDNLTPIAIIDIALVALTLFGASLFIRGTQAVALLRGTLVVLVGMIIVTNVFQLVAFRWLLGNILTVLVVALPIIFQPELRRGLEQLGRAGLLTGNSRAPDSVRAHIIDEVCQAAERLSERRHGALIVLQRNSSVAEYISTGIALDSEVTAALLLTIFWPKTELHDGAAIINHDGRLAVAAAVLPLSASRNMTDRKLGTRHRAAVGMSEVGDSIIVVVSEETGKIAIANGGRLIPRLDAKRLRTILNAVYGSDRKQKGSIWQRTRERSQQWLTQLRDGRNQA